MYFIKSFGTFSQIKKKKIITENFNLLFVQSTILGKFGFKMLMFEIF